MASMGTQHKRSCIATVERIEQLSPHLRRLRLASPSLASWSLEAGAKVKLCVAGVKRSYTPSRMGSDEAWMEVIVHLHGNGPLARWAADCKRGEEVHIRGPKSSLKGPDGDEHWAVLLGDATALGLACALADALPDDVALQGAIELADADFRALEVLGLERLEAASFSQRPGDALIDWLDSMDFPEGPGGVIWLAGHKPSIYRARTHIQHLGIEADLRFKGYWD